MFYRYEAKDDDGNYVGIFQILNPSQRRYFNRFVKEPSWYQKHPDTDSRCWFTEKGYQKYHHIINEFIDEYQNLEVRILTTNTLSNICSKGSIQCIEQLTPLH